MELARFPNVSLTAARVVLDDFLKSSARPVHPLPDHLRTIVERELHTLHREMMELDNIERLAPITPGPIVNILINPTTVTVEDADLPAHVRSLMRTNRQASQIRPVIWVPAVLLLGVGVTAAYILHLAVNPLMVSSIAVLMFTVFWLRRPALRYHPIEFDDALAIARYHRQAPETRASLSRLRLRGPTGGPHPQPDATPPNASDDDRSAAKHGRAKLGLANRGRAKRIAEVHAAIAELDSEWLDYELDLRAWFLTKPQLRNNNDPAVAAYRDAYVTLRNKAAELTDSATEDQIDDAQRAARTALTTWHDANALALERGVNDLSPSEEAALTRLYGLVSQLNDRSTPKAMWPNLITAITRTMDKLTTVPFTLDYIAGLPVIEAESRLRELAP